MDDTSLITTIISGLISLFVLIFVLVKLNGIEKNTRSTNKFFNKEEFNSLMLKGDKNKLTQFMQDETIRLLAWNYELDKGLSDKYVDNTEYVVEYITRLCKKYELELPEVLVKFDTTDKIKTILK